MRTTYTPAADVEAAITKAREERGLGMSEAIDYLVRQGLVAPREKQKRFKQKTYDLGFLVDISNTGEVIGMLDDEDWAEQQARDAR